MSRQPIRQPVLRRLCAALATLALPPLAFAAPSGGEVVAGSASITQGGSTTTITQASDRAVINWQSFGVGRGEAVNFVQPGSSAIALNRVIGNERSVIDGTITANGQVFLVNSNGVLFGAGSSVNTAGLVASTRDIANADFLAGNFSFAGSGAGGVENRGSIATTEGGYVALLGRSVSNAGGITTPEGMTALAAGDRITLTLAGNSLVSLSIDAGTLAALVENSGAIVADGGRILLTARAADEIAGAQVNTTGLLRARTIDDLKGSIIVMADGGKAGIAGTLDASAPAGGDGGFVETSGKQVAIADGTVITTAAASGKTGQWLIDPDGFTIGAGGDISAALLSTLLASNNVSIESTMGSGSDGNLVVKDAVSWSAGTVLGLKATNDIDINAPITATGAGAGLRLDYGGDYHLASGASVTLSGADASLVINGTGYQLIHSLAELAALDDNEQATAGGHYALAQDIEAGGTTYGGAILGNLSGTLAGMGHEVKGLTILGDLIYNAWTIGLVSMAGDTAVIRDIGVTGADVQSYGQVGALVGMNRGLISNAWSSGEVAGNFQTGGLVGFNFGTIENSHSSAKVTGGDFDSFFSDIGGLVGRNFNGTIRDSWASGAVTVIEADSNHSVLNIGGLVGSTMQGTIMRSHASGDVTVSEQTSQVGGLAGQSSSSTISDSYATGNVSGGGRFSGGLVGSMLQGTITNSWASGNVSGRDFSTVSSAGGLVGSSDGGVISNSHATGDVNGSSAMLGGLVGSNGGSIVNSWASGNVTGTGNNVAGGLVGDNYANGSISGSWATGNVQGELAGGLAGGNGGSISGSWASGNVSGQTGGGLVGTNGGSIDSSTATGSVDTANGSGGLVGSNMVNGEVVGTVTNSSYRDVAGERAQFQREQAATTAAASLRDAVTTTARRPAAADAASALPPRAPSLASLLTVLDRSRYSASVRRIESEGKVYELSDDEDDDEAPAEQR